MKIGIVGAGRWGCTLATFFHNEGHEVTIYCLDGELYPKNIPRTQFKFNQKIRMTMSAQSLSDCEIVFFTVNGSSLAASWEQWGKNIDGTVVIAVKCLLHKGSNLMLPCDVIPYNNTVYFASAAFPEDILQRHPTMGTVYGDKFLSNKVRSIIPKEVIRTYWSDDMIGGQIGSALKNVIAIATGIAEGLGYGRMTQSTIITRAMNEICNFGIIQGAYPRTFRGGTSINADLIGTCSTSISHNFQAGLGLAAGESVSEIIKRIGTVEGIQAAHALDHLRSIGDMPIANAVIHVLAGNDPRDEVRKISDRPLTQL